MYAVVDIETTGNFTGRHKITEIAIYIFDGKKIVDEYQTLINPETSIPPYISSMTGITNKMVENAMKGNWSWKVAATKYQNLYYNVLS